MAFAGAGIACAVIAFAVDSHAAARVLRRPLPLVLVALALLAALSLLWTLGPEERTLRWAGVTLGYAGVLLGAAVASRERTGRLVLMGGLAAIAAVAGGIGLFAWAVHDHPHALRIGGSWRPAGPFEYPPALALLMVSALPVFIDAARARRRPLAGFGIAGIALTAAVLALASSRIGLALGLAIAGLVLFRRSVLVVIAVGAVALAAGGVAFGSGDGPSSGFLHGRGDTWSAAIDTFLDRPALGAGADAFLAGSARHQEGAAILFAHDLPLELAAELGVAGLLLALGLYWATAHALWDARTRRAFWAFGPAAIAFPLANLLDWPWHLAGAGAVWALAAGAVEGAGLSARKQPY